MKEQLMKEQLKNLEYYKRNNLIIETERSQKRKEE